MASNWSTDELEGLRVSEAIRQGVLTERDELRTEVERLRADARRSDTCWKEVLRLRAENDRLRAALAEFASISRTGEPVDMPDAKAMWRRVRDVVDRHME